jgi:putative tricarboxylic transport membrane protein
VVDWIAYGHAVQTTPDKKNFGSGEIRGIIGPESSNNAKEGGGLVPTLIFGIPVQGPWPFLSAACCSWVMTPGPS